MLARPTRPPRPMRLPPPPPTLQHQQASPFDRFRPDRPRQSELHRQLEERNPQLVRPRQQQHPQAPQSVRPRQPPELKPYQLKSKRGQETFIEPPVEQKEVPPPNSKQIKHMKKKLGKLNTKLRHSKKKHNNLISK